MHWDSLDQVRSTRGEAQGNANAFNNFWTIYKVQP